MLTKEDLSAIGTVVDKRLDLRISPIERRLKSIEKDVIYVRKSMGTIVKSFDKDYLDLRRRVEHLEQLAGIQELPV